MYGFYSSIRRGRSTKAPKVVELMNLRYPDDIEYKLFKYQLDKYLSTITDTPCIANYGNSLENSSHTNPHLLTGVHPV